MRSTKGIISTLGFAVSIVTLATAAPASGAQKPKPACLLISKSEVAKVLKGHLREAGGQSAICVFTNPTGARLIVSDVPNSAKYQRAVRMGTSTVNAGPRQSVMIGGVMGYYQPKYFESPKTPGSALYVTFHNYFIIVGLTKGRNLKSTEEHILEEVMQHF
jgi:hypothetical protein